MEWSAKDGTSIYDAAGSGVNPTKGTYGVAEEWHDLEGGAVQINTQLDLNTMINAGIIDNVERGIPIKAK